MKKLANIDYVSYDSMIIVYYYFNINKNRIIEFSEKSHRLTEFLINNNTKIIVPSFLISEIKRKDTMEMISKYISTKQITNIPPKPNPTIKLGLDFKFKTKFNQLLKKEWFIVEKYDPPKELYDPLEDFFNQLINDAKIKNFLKKKRRDTVMPSFEDLGLMAFSKDKEYPIISNDNDLTFFADELYKKKLTYLIYNFNDLDIYNN